MDQNINILENIEVLEKDCFYTHKRNGETLSGTFPLRDILFGGEIFGKKHDGYIPYIEARMSVELNEIMFQGLLNCLSKSLLSITEIQDENVQREEFINLEDLIINDLYGYLHDFPEALVTNGVPRNCSIENLITQCKKLQIQKRKQEVGEKFTNKVFKICGIENNTHGEERLYKYMVKKYGDGGSPKLEEIKDLGLSAHTISTILYSGSYSQVESIVSPKPKLLGENGEYKLLELITMEHLEEQTDITGICVGESGFYYDKMSDNKIRIFSFEDTSSGIHYTIEYEIKTQSIIQWEGHDSNREVSIELYPKIIQLLEESGILVNDLRESYKDKLGQDTILGKRKGEKHFSTYQLSHHRIDLPEEIREIYASCHEMERVTGGNFVLNENDTYKNLVEIFDWPGAIIDITNLPNEEKNKIQKVQGSLIDKSDNLDLKSLTFVGGNLYCGDSDVFSSRSIKLNSLEFVGEDFDCKGVETIEANNLKSVGKDFTASDAKHIHCPKLRYVKYNLYLNSVETGDLSSLVRCTYLNPKKGHSVSFSPDLEYSASY